MFLDETGVRVLSWINPNLNPEQRSAVVRSVVVALLSTKQAMLCSPCVAQCSVFPLICFMFKCSLFHVPSVLCCPLKCSIFHDLCTPGSIVLCSLFSVLSFIFQSSLFQLTSTIVPSMCFQNPEWRRSTLPLHYIRTSGHWENSYSGRGCTAGETEIRSYRGRNLVKK